ncbi:MAG: hypothetical protein CVT92_03985 [Bacteroidetes bacterium HGW-Bacteroidetes-1]|jgi:hypothetical protein|nr:MAG: hypothetical protein CVT92_03985 [Bacteroidetes bacterium HGW-Bacteroidetes-1]
MKKLTYFIPFLTALLFYCTGFAQDRAYVHEVVKRLSAHEMHGRGYVNSGDHKAADYLAKEMKRAGLNPYFEAFKQKYHFTVNSFPSQVIVRTEERKLKAGEDFVVNPATASLKKTFDLIWLPDTITSNASVYLFADTTALEGKMLVVPEDLKNAYRFGIPGVKALVQTVSGSMWWHVSQKQNEQGQIALKIIKEKLSKETETIHVDIISKQLKDRPAYNLAGFVRGNVQPDSFMVFVAHYDHLGRMGRQTYFPGASDNASGTATILDLGRYYASHPEKSFYTMVFVLVSGEEAGLLGSSYFAENAPFSLDKTKFVINLDMVGTGSDGLSVVNAKQFPEAFNIIDSLNKKHSFFPDIRAGGESCNSDHCPFYKKGVPAFFLFTRGNENRNYHNTADTYYKLPFTAYEQLFGILTGFAEELQTAPSFRE